MSGNHPSYPSAGKEMNVKKQIKLAFERFAVNREERKEEPMAATAKDTLTP